MFVCSVQVTFIACFVCPRKKDPSSVVLPEVSYFPCLGFLSFSSPGLRVLRAEDVTFVQFIEVNCDFGLFDIHSCVSCGQVKPVASGMSSSTTSYRFICYLFTSGPCLQYNFLLE